MVPWRSADFSDTASDSLWKPHTRLCLAEPMITSTERLVDTNGVRLRVTEAGDRGAPVVVLAHGFPELAYSWRHQIPALADAGYHVLAPDQRGYGGSQPARRGRGLRHRRPDRRPGRAARRRRRASRRCSSATTGARWWCGSSPLLHPDRVAAVVGMSVPPVPRARRCRRRGVAADVRRQLLLHPVLPGARRGRRRTGRRPGDDDAAHAGRPAATGDAAAALRMFAPGPEGFVERLPEPDGLPDWISAGRARPLHRRVHPHRLHRRPELVPQLRPQLGAHADTAGATIAVPALFIGGTADPVLGFMPPDRATRGGRPATTAQVMIDGAGHWVQQERPDEVNAALLEFLPNRMWSRQ